MVRCAQGKTSKALGFEILQASGGVLGGYTPVSVNGGRLSVTGDHHHHQPDKEGRNNLQAMAAQASLSPTRSSKRMLTDAGMCRQASVVDEVVFGRDMDGSTGLVQDVRQAVAYRGAQGKTSAQLGDAGALGLLGLGWRGLLGLRGSQVRRSEVR